MTETEPEFDAVERDAWLALWEWETGICPQCNGPSYLCSDPESVWYATQQICYRTSVTRGANRLWTKRHENAKPDSLGMLPTDGVVVWSSPVDLDPDNENDFLGLAAAANADLDGLRDASTDQPQ